MILFYTIVSLLPHGSIKFHKQNLYFLQNYQHNANKYFTVYSTYDKLEKYTSYKNAEYNTPFKFYARKSF